MSSKAKWREICTPSKARYQARSARRKFIGFDRKVGALEQFCQIINTSRLLTWGIHAWEADQPLGTP